MLWARFLIVFRNIVKNFEVPRRDDNRLSFSSRANCVAFMEPCHLVTSLRDTAIVANLAEIEDSRDGAVWMLAHSFPNATLLQPQPA